MCDCVVTVSRANQDVSAVSEPKRLRSSSNGVDELLGG